MGTALATKNEMSVAQLEAVICKGDLATLAPVERIKYYQSICEHVGVNPATRPFEYLVLNGKTVLYARKDCTEQLRANRKISLAIVSKEEDKEGGTYTVVVKASLPDGRSDEATGSVSLLKTKVTVETDKSGREKKVYGDPEPLRGDDRANAIMKAETKAKRRATLSICGLGFLDETELETIPAKSMKDGPPIRPDQSEKLLILLGNDPGRIKANLKPYDTTTLGKLTSIQADDLIKFLEIAK